MNRLNLYRYLSSTPSLIKPKHFTNSHKLIFKNVHQLSPSPYFTFQHTSLQERTVKINYNKQFLPQNHYSTQQKPVDNNINIETVSINKTTTTNDTLNSTTRKEITNDSSNASNEINFEKNLSNIHDMLNVYIKLVFDSRMEYRMYTADLEFNNFWNSAKPAFSKGITSYVLQILKYRFYFHFRYPKIKVNVIASKTDQEKGTVRFDWTILLVNTKGMLKIREVTPSKMKQSANQHAEVMEGHSTFFVNKKGFIHKHILEKGHQLSSNDAGGSRDIDQSNEANPKISS